MANHRNDDNIYRHIRLLGDANELKNIVSLRDTPVRDRRSQPWTARMKGDRPWGNLSGPTLHSGPSLEHLGQDLMPVADALQPIYHLLNRASIEYVAPTSMHTDIIERGPHYASIPEPIRSYIAKQLPPTGAIPTGAITKHKNRTSITTKFVLKQSGRSIHVHIHPLESTHDPDEVVRLIWIWLQTLDAILVGRGSSPSRTASCSRELHIYLYLTPLRKMWPSSHMDIEETHVNSGFAFPCSESASGLNHIYVFREEEWFKVLIHETIHAFGVDFSVASDTVDKDTNEAIRALDTAFPGVMAAHNADKNCICLFEAYTECWAEWIAILFRVHEYGKPTQWKSEFVRHLELERRWSMLQASRMRAWYASDPVRMYGAPTPIFAYYILKSILMYHCVAFAAWCKSHNSHMLVSDPVHIKAFGEFLRDHSLEIPREHTNHGEKLMPESLRMSLWGD